MSVGLVVAIVLTGCGEDEPDYCAQVEAESHGLTRTVDEGGPAGLLAALPTLQDLADAAPDDVRRDWALFVGALEGLRDALDEAGLDPAEVDDPAKVKDHQGVVDAASRLESAEVANAAQRVEQHALDVCHTPLL